jgi:hypothetical protein
LDDDNDRFARKAKVDVLAAKEASRLATWLMKASPGASVATSTFDGQIDQQSVVVAIGKN